jgi:AcrR family transcriptional regulator
MLAAEGVAGLTTRRLAAEASTSTPAVYELFGDKAGLLRELFGEGFRMMRRHYEGMVRSDDPLEDVVGLTRLYRTFAAENPHLVGVMFSQSFADLDPGPVEARAATEVRELIIGCVQRAVDAGELDGDANDISHGLLALMIGLGGAEIAARLGRRPESIDRRWDQSVRALLRGYAPSSVDR